MMHSRPVWLTVGTAHRPGELPDILVWARKPVRDTDGIIDGGLLTPLCGVGVRFALGLRMQPGDMKYGVLSFEEITEGEGHMRAPFTLKLRGYELHDGDGNIIEENLGHTFTLGNQEALVGMQDELRKASDALFSNLNKFAGQIASKGKKK